MAEGKRIEGEELNEGDTGRKVEREKLGKWIKKQELVGGGGQEERSRRKRWSKEEEQEGKEASEARNKAKTATGDGQVVN